MFEITPVYSQDEIKNPKFNSFSFLKVAESNRQEIWAGMTLMILFWHSKALDINLS